jgi:NAD-dependent SIR2 family protein deacetylase
MPHFRRAAELIANADALVVADGAGIGVDSGLPDFLGNTGFWSAYRAIAKAQINFTDIAKCRRLVTIICHAGTLKKVGK